MHSRFDEINKYGDPCSRKQIKENKCYGGFARMKQAAKDAAKSALKQNISTVFINAGDTFQGTSYYSVFKRKIVAPLIDSLQLDVMSLGTHEFDDGIDNLVEYLNQIKTPVVACNFNISTEKRLNLTNLTPSRIVNASGEMIGIIGYLTPDTTIKSRTENLEIFDEIPNIRAEAKRLKSNGIKIIIALGHSGFNFDRKLAAQVNEISMVVGGYSHTLQYTPKEPSPSNEKATEKYPYVVVQKSGKKVPVVQAYAYTKYLGKLMVTFDDAGNVISAKGNPIQLDYMIKKDADVEKLVASWSTLLQNELNTVIGYTRVLLKKTDYSEREFESNIGNMITDAMIDSVVHIAKKKNLTNWSNAPIAVYPNSEIKSVIKNTKPEGAITLADLLKVLPSNNQLFTSRISGSTLKFFLEFSVSEYETRRNNSLYNFLPYFVNFSGLKINFNFTEEPYNRINSIMMVCDQCSIPKYEAIDEDKIYNVITGFFIKDGDDTFYKYKNYISSSEKLGITDTECVFSYIKKMKIVYPILEGRIQISGMDKSFSVGGVHISCTLLFICSFISYFK
ncbi:hypothetical protein PGB90_004991 [Kerria lacca]